MSALKDILARLFLAAEKQEATRDSYDDALDMQRTDTERAQRLQRLQRQLVPLSAEMESTIATGNPDALTPTPMLRATVKWLGAPKAPPVLMLCGRAGSGKTVAAAWALAERGGRWRNAAQVARHFSSSSWPALDEQEAILRAPFLAFDDLGSESEPERMAGALLEILEARQNARRFRTLVSTNLDREGLLRRYENERLRSRLGDARAVAWVTDFKSSDMRKGG